MPINSTELQFVEAKHVKEAGRVAKNSVLLIVGQLIGRIVNFLYVLWMARYLGAAGFGILSFALSVATIAAVFVDMGFQPLLVREIARNRGRGPKYLANVLAIKTGAAVVLFVGCTGGVWIAGYPAQTCKVVALMTASIFFNSFITTFQAVFRGFEEMAYQAGSQVVASVAMLAGVAIVIWTDGGVVAFAVVYAVVSLVILVLNLVICLWKFVIPRLGLEKQTVWYLLKEALPFALTGIFLTVYFRIDSIMLSGMKGDEAVGIYGAAYRIVMVLLLIPGAVAQSVYPLMSRLYAGRPQALGTVYRASIKYALIIAAPLAGGICLTSGKLITLLFGQAYSAAGTVLSISVWSFALAFVGSISAYFINSLNKQATQTKIVGLAAAVNVILNFILIPSLSYNGAAIATVATQFLVVVLQILAIRRITRRPECQIYVDFAALTRLGMKSILGLVPCAVVITLTDDLFFAVPLCALLYLTSIIVMKYFDAADADFLRHLLRNLWSKVVAMKK